MNTELRDKIKKHGIHRFINSFRFAFAGLKYAFKYEQNMLAHILATLVVVVLGIALNLSFTEWIIIILVIGLVVATELINTSIEAVVDLTCKEINPIAKIAKDTAAAAVLIFALTAVLVALLIFVPKIFVLF